MVKGGHPLQPGAAKVRRVDSPRRERGGEEPKEGAQGQAQPPQTPREEIDLLVDEDPAQAHPAEVQVRERREVGVAVGGGVQRGVELVGEAYITPAHVDKVASGKARGGDYLGTKGAVHVDITWCCNLPEVVLWDLLEILERDEVGARPGKQG